MSGNNQQAAGHNWASNRYQPARIPELHGLLFTSGRKDSGESYINTKEAMADYLGVTYDMSMRKLVKNEKETVFTEPTLPTDPKVTGTMEKYKIEIDLYHKKKHQYNGWKAKSLVHILNQCDMTTLTHVKHDPDFNDMEETFNVLGLLKLLKKISYADGSASKPMLMAVMMARRFLAINQGPTETISNYHRRFVTGAETLDELWGNFLPIKMTKGVSDQETEETKQEFLSIHFLLGADNNRFGRIRTSLNDQFLSGKDVYPTSLKKCLKLLSNCEHGGAQQGTNSSNVAEGTAFVQLKKNKKKWKNLTCHQCGEKGHIKRQCPQLQPGAAQAHAQTGGSDDEEDDEYEPSFS